MPSRLVLLLLFIFGTSLQGQSQTDSCDCGTDLAYLHDQVPKMPAYRINKAVYQSAYAIAQEEVTSVNSVYDCHLLLNTLLLSLNDNHSRVYSIDPGASAKTRRDAEKLAAFKAGELYNAYPRPDVDLDSLRTALAREDWSAIEGIYHRPGYATLGVRQSTTGENYEAIVLDAETEVWEPGELMYTLIPARNGILLNVGGGLTSKFLQAYNERISDGVFQFLGFSKHPDEPQFSVDLPTEDTYYRTELTDDITYLRIGSFEAWQPTLGEAEKFYEAIDGTLNRPHLIIDLRDNDGGGNRNSNILYKQLKAYAKTGHLHVLTNFRTLSNGEMFADKLSRLNNSTLYGQATNGTLSYEIKGGSHELPCGSLMAVLTTKKRSEYLPYESKGVEPDIVFDNSEDWLRRLTRLIEEGSR